MEGIAPYTRAMDAPTPLTTDERLERIESTIKKATIRLEEHIDDSSIKAIGAFDWAKIGFRMSLGLLIAQAIVFVAGIVGLMLLYVLAVATRR